MLSKTPPLIRIEARPRKNKLRHGSQTSHWSH